MQKKLLVICPYPEGIAAGQRLKYEQYFVGLNNRGISITVRPFFDKNGWDALYKDGRYLNKVIATLKGYFRRTKTLFEVKDYDAVYIFMWVAPFFDRFFETLIRIFSKRLVYDFDDSIHQEIDPNIDKFYKKFFKGRQKIKYLIRNSDFVITSSPFNLDYCLENNINSNAIYIPCTLNSDRFKPKDYKDESKQITLGWTGTFTSKNYLDSIRDVLIESCQKYNLKLILITNFEYSISEVNSEVIYWKEESEIEDLQKIDIGLYPLIASNWALGKGGLKVLQYMSVGIPSISTNFGTAINIVEHGVDGYLADSKDDWLNYISILVNDSDRRSNMGKAARKKVIENYSIGVNLHKYISAIEGS